MGYQQGMKKGCPTAALFFARTELCQPQWGHNLNLITF